MTSRVLSVLLMLILALSACSNVPLIVNKQVHIATLGLCVNFNEHVQQDDRLLYLDATKEFVDEYNRQGLKGPRLDTCKKGQRDQLNVLIQRDRYVEPSEQALYIVLSIAGIAYPLSGGSFGFVWFGMNSTSVELSLSESIGGKEKPVYRQVYSSPYFKGPESLRISHMESYKAMLKESVKEIVGQLNSNTG